MRPLVGLGLLALAALPACHGRAAPPTAVVYVSDEEAGDVVAIDPMAGTILTRIPVGKRPRGMKVSPDGKRLYVVLSGSPRAALGVEESNVPGDRSADGIGVVDLAQRRLVATYRSGQDPETIDVSPDGRTLYVSNEETSEMTAVDATTGTIRGAVHVGKEPEGVTVRPDGKVVFVTSEASSEVTAVDAESLAVLAHIPTGPRPRSVAIAKDGHTAFATDEFGAMLTVFDAAIFKEQGTIKLRLDSPMPSGPRPMGAVFSPDGRWLYVSCGRGGSVAVIDVATRTQVRSIDGVGDRPWGVSPSADGARLFTANGTSHDVSIVDIATGNVDRRVYVGGLPWGLVVGS
jgi:YVTN family beta-propeller protein